MKIGAMVLPLICALAFSAAFAAPEAAMPSTDWRAAMGAVKASDPKQLDDLVQQHPTLIGPAQANDLIVDAALALTAAPEGKVAAAQDVVRILVRRGASIGEKHLAGPLDGMSFIPITVIGRRPGERGFVMELLRDVPPKMRCAVLADMIDDGNPGQWENALSGVAMVPVSMRRSSACAAIFNNATRGTGEFVTQRVEALLDAGLFPDPKTMGDIANRLPESSAARKVLGRLLSDVDLDAVYTVRSQAYGSLPQQSSVFSFLFDETMQRGGGALQANLSKMPEWRAMLSTHGDSPVTCADTAHLDDAAMRWEDAVDGSVSGDLLAGLVAGTRWLIVHCSAELRSSQSQANWANTHAWVRMIDAGYPDLVMLAATQGLVSADDASVRMAALRHGNATLFIHLMADRKAPATLRDFMATLAPQERRPANGGDIDVLRWLIAHGTDPNAPVFGDAPIAVARFFDRDDVTQVLLDAGVKPTVLTGARRAGWLRQRLDIDAGFDPPIQVPRDDEADADDASEPRGGLRQVDLNGDGMPEYINYDGYCGNVNCEFAVFAYRNRQWHIVLDGAADSVDVQRTRHHGWQDIVTDARASAAEHDTTRYRYDGRRYVVERRDSTLLK